VLFEQFLQERLYLRGVSPATMRYYPLGAGAFEPILENPSKAGMLECVQKLRTEGVSATSINTYLRGFKAYIRWLHAEVTSKKFSKCSSSRSRNIISRHGRTNPEDDATRGQRDTGTPYRTRNPGHGPENFGSVGNQERRHRLRPAHHKGLG
jgi:hypothetical protein